MKKSVYLDCTKSIEERVDDLIGKMTIDEKLQQIVASGCNDISRFAERINNGENLVLSGTFVFNDFNANDFNIVQKYLVEKTRLGIPCLLAGENTHGVNNPYATVYPTAGCMAATFDERLVEKMAKFSATEARALGIRQVYAPNIDIARDSRWGRTEESFSEDVYLTAQMGSAYVRGLQSQGVAATAKHYIAYGVGEGGLNLAPAHIGEREIRNDMLPAFEACIKAGVWSVMPSYNEIDGVPVHASKFWLKKVLREELGFDGMVVTDYGATNMLTDFHNFENSLVKIGKIILENEIDFEASEAYGYSDDFREEVRKGNVSIKQLDQCVKNVLRLKFRTGLFENPYIDENYINKLHREEYVNLSLEIAQKGIVLLKNDGILPLKKNLKLGIFGCNSVVNQMGNYIYYEMQGDELSTPCVTEQSKNLVEVFEEQFTGNVIHTKGCGYVFGDEEEYSKAEILARDCDVMILALGDNSTEKSGGVQSKSSVSMRDDVVTSGEGFDMNFVELPKSQLELFNRLKKLGKPIVLVLYGGRAHAITEQLPDLSAVVFAFGAGELGSRAIYDIITGKVCPSGRLPLSFPRSTGHIPCFYNHKGSARGRLYREPGSSLQPGRDYVLDTPEPLFPFGFGLSYTKFEYSNLQVDATDYQRVEVRVDIENIGDYHADEVALLFISCHFRDVTPEVKKLVRYKRVNLKTGEKKQVTFSLSEEDFVYTGQDMKKHIAFSNYDFMIADLKITAEIADK